MPDISRSDSNRSNASRPRVSFNRDVHVKRINGPKTSNAYSLSLDGTNVAAMSQRKERPPTKKEMTKEAELVLKQMDKISCWATSNIPPPSNKRKKEKKKSSASFLAKLNKIGKHSISSSDVDSGSSQELRIYKINDPICRNNVVTKSEHESDHLPEENKNNSYKKKIYDFMSLDRQKKRNKKRNLDYLSLERSRDDLNKAKKENLNKSLIFMGLEKVDGKNKKEILPTNGTAFTECKNNVKLKPEITSGTLTEKVEKKKQVPLFKEEIKNYFEKEKNNIENTVRAEKNFLKLNKNVETAGVKEFQPNVDHNNVRTFSCTNIPNNNRELKLNSTSTENLGDGEKNLKSLSPTCDVIYAQVVVSGRSGNTHKPTVNEKAVSDEVGQAIVGDKLEKFEKSLNINIDSDPSYNIPDKSAASSNKIWQSKSDSFNEARAKENVKMEQGIIYENNLGRREQEDCSRIVKILPLKNEGSKHGNKSYSDLKNLSIRREILLSRSESQAKERFNSLKKIQEQTRIKKDVPITTDFQIRNEALKNEPKHFGEGIKGDEKFGNTLRKIPKDVEPMNSEVKTKKDSKWDATEKKQKDKKEKFRHDKGEVHLIKTDDGDDNNNLLRKINRLGKSKSFIEKKPKSNRMESVKMLFRKKKEEKNPDSEDDALTSRYMAYRGSDIDLSCRSPDSSSKKPATQIPLSSSECVSSGLKRLSTPICNESMENLTKIKNIKNKELDWSNSGQKDSGTKEKIKVEDIAFGATNALKPMNLRFFGDTDQESISQDHLPQQKSKFGTFKSLRTTDSDEESLVAYSRTESRATNSTSKDFSTGKHKTKYDLDRPDYGLKQMNHSLHIKNNRNDPFQYSNAMDSSTPTNENFDINGLKFGPKITRSVSSVTQSSKNPGQQKWTNLTGSSTIGRNAKNNSFSKKVQSHGNLFAQEERGKGRRRQYDSSAESITEGDSSQHSLKSMIYLHAAAVGDIPGPRNLYKNDRRSQSREELSSIGDSSTILTPNKKTLSRSISVLAPWRPKHNKEDRILYYDSVDFHKGKPPSGIGKSRNPSKDRKTNELKFNTLRKENRRRKDVLR